MDWNYKIDIILWNCTVDDILMAFFVFGTNENCAKPVRRVICKKLDV